MVRQPLRCGSMPARSVVVEEAGRARLEAAPGLTRPFDPSDMSSDDMELL